MGKKDIYSKDLLKRNDYFADTVNYVLFNGKRIVMPDSLQELDTTELSIIDTGNKRKPVQKYRDILKQAVIRKDNNAIYLIIGAEGQTDVHYAMPVKNNLYDALRYAKQVEQIADEHKRNPDKTRTNAEFLSGFDKADRIIPVISVTVYFGAEEWDGPRSIHDMFVDTVDEELLSVIPDYRVHLLEPTKVKDWTKFNSDIGILYQLISVSNEKKGIKEAIDAEPDRFKQVDNKIVQAVNFYTNTNLPIDETKEATDMCYAMQSYWDEAYTQGETDGINKGMAKGMVQGAELERDKVLDELVAASVISKETAMEYRKKNSNKA